ncbi:DsrE family protein [candidate division KSB1 bacterium]
MKAIHTTLLCLFVLISVSAATTLAGPESATSDNLVVVWTSDDRDVAERMVFMYSNAAKNNGWWGRVRLVVWGPSSKLLAEDKGLQDYLKKMQTAGVEVQACIVCADMYGVTDKLRSLDIEVKGMGKPLTDMLKNGWTCLTF